MIAELDKRTAADAHVAEAQAAYDDLGFNLCLRLYKSVSKIQRPANPHEFLTDVYDFN